MKSQRIGNATRATRETTIECEVNLDGTGRGAVETGLPFFDHMLTAFAKHALIDVSLRCAGDLEVDDHHTIEDCALSLGLAVSESLGDRAGIVRFGSAYAPLDESLARAVVDLSGRPHATVELALVRDSIGPVATENLTHFFRSFAVGSGCALHVDVLRGDNDHHKAESAFKAFALALREAVALDPRRTGIPSTKGVL